MSDLGGAARTLLAPHLWAGENVLWCERPASAGAVAVAAARRGAYEGLGAVAGIAFFGYLAMRALEDYEPGARTVVLMIDGVAIVGAVAWSATRASWHARRALSATAYAVTTRRVLVVRGDDIEWIAARELEGYLVNGHDVVIRRGRSEIEDLWAAERHAGTVQPRMFDAAEQEGRSVTLAGVRDPASVVAAIQTLRLHAAS